jgi:hypothetical protein
VTIDDGTGFLIYLPNTGYKVSFLNDGDSDVPIDFSVEVTTLGYDGFNTAMATYNAPSAGTGGEIITLDMTSNTVTAQNLGTLDASGETVEPVVFYDQWEIESAKTVSVDETVTITLSGADVETGNVEASDLAWSSSDPEIASVSEDGEVTGLAVGETVIFATAQNESYKFSRSVVTVTAAGETPNPDDPAGPGNPNNPDDPDGGQSGGASGGGGGGCQAGTIGWAVFLIAAIVVTQKKRWDV